ncbi:ArsR/SmtB family transcription factor [Pseudofrankia asymbiotica]|uniref:ArsR/SmtB family transcription factor n=1 Tax=Pseudofrankia asymbiotica TaxID=1834516 RepID=UPI0009D76833|nr:metalloregulator ArsR/SmtB family transcription factor [Pseudofrankia asymbiotica]
MDQLSQVFAALADPTRRDLVARLTDGDATVGELAAPYAVSVQAVSKHLKVLEQAGLVSRADGAHRSPVHLEAKVFDLATAWLERYRRQAEQRYRRLDAVLAAMNDDEKDENDDKNGENAGHPAGRPTNHPGTKNLSKSSARARGAAESRESA